MERGVFLTVKEPTFTAEAAVIKKKRLFVAARPQDYAGLHARTYNKKYVVYVD